MTELGDIGVVGVVGVTGPVVVVGLFPVVTDGNFFFLRNVSEVGPDINASMKPELSMTLCFAVAVAVKSG